ncbi:MAG: adenylate/guanylate cyclase domain-containing protein [bacterium]|nr:adenylate/guanylate cyclase domain-containing protein [bacterium]
MSGLLKKSAPILIPLAGSFIALLFWFAGVFGGFETTLEDRQFRTKAIDSNIVIVSIDSDSIQSIGQWPWPRSVFANFFTTLNAAPPKAVGLDVIFAEPSRVGKTDDATLSRVLQTLSYPLVMPIEASSLNLSSTPPKATSVLTPLSTFTLNSKVSLGAVNLIIDQDTVVRRFPAHIAYSSGTLSAFALETARQSGQAIPREPSAVERIVYAAPTGAVRHISFTRALENPSLLKDKIVFVGVTAPDLHDEQATPVDHGTKMSGVEIQAQIANMLLKGYTLSPIAPLWGTLWIVVLGLLPGLFFFLLKRRTLLALLVSAAGGVISTLGILILFDKGTVVSLIHTNVAWILSAGSLFTYRYTLARREIKEVKGVFGKYVSKEVLELILKNPSAVLLGGEEREVTVLFSDIRGFTSLSEATTPRELVSVLNRYFTLMTNEVFKHQGVLDKYIGDAIMAFWGAPIADPRQADHALDAAFAMIERLKEFNEELVREGKPTIDIGIGLYTGPVIVGNIGAESRFDYTVIGDTVNTASRLEGVNKEYKTHIIVGESTKQKLTGSYALSHLGEVKVKGKEKGIEIYTAAV